jgi:hypothetical protein
MVAGKGRRMRKPRLPHLSRSLRRMGIPSQWLERSLRCVLVANRSHDADVPNASEHLGSNVGAAWVIAEVFGEQLFAPVRRGEACLNRYLRNGVSPDQIPLYYVMDRLLGTSMFVCPNQVPAERIGKVTPKSLVLQCAPSFSGKRTPPSAHWRQRPRRSTPLRLR